MLLLPSAPDKDRRPRGCHPCVLFARAVPGLTPHAACSPTSLWRGPGVRACRDCCRRGLTPPAHLAGLTQVSPRALAYSSCSSTPRRPRPLDPRRGPPRLFSDRPHPACSPADGRQLAVALLSTLGPPRRARTDHLLRACSTSVVRRCPLRPRQDPFFAVGPMRRDAGPALAQPGDPDYVDLLMVATRRVSTSRTARWGAITTTRR